MKRKPKFTITEEMLSYVADIAEIVGGIRSLNTLDRFPKLCTDSRIKSIHSTLVFVNNSLTSEKVASIYEGKNAVGFSEDICEIQNAISAYDELDNLDPFDVDELVRVHGIMTKDFAHDSGKFRTSGSGVYCGDGQLLRMMPPPNTIPRLLNDLFFWLNTSKSHPLIKACVFHYELYSICPFSEGNGLMGRLWQTAILMSWKPIFEWIPIESYIIERMSKYFSVRENSVRQDNSSMFVQFMLKGILKAVQEFVAELKSQVNHNNISSFVNVMARMGDLLKALKDPAPKSAQELMSLMNIKSRNSLRLNYLNPAIGSGLVGLTMPDRPKSRFQKYYKK
jgi:Fic family protein